MPGPDKLAKVADLTDTNICAPGTLEPGGTYCWRVDAVRGDDVVRGDVWRFRAAGTDGV